MKQFADVILPLPLQPLTYHIPAIYQNKVEIGSGVLVPFRSGKLLLGIVVRCHTTIPTYSTKDLLSVLYTKPVFTPEQLTFLTWLSDYYLTNLGTTLSLAWPKLLHFPHNILFQINGKIEDHRFSAKRAYEISTTQHAIQTALQYQPLTYASIMQLIDQKEASKSLIVLLSKRLVEAIVTTSIEPIRLPPSIFTQPLQPLAILTPFQKNALSAIEIEFTQKTAVLLHGAIGSGKTELYMHLIASALAQQKQVLLLAPEIGLVTHIVERIRPLWGEWLVVYHSKQSHKERLKTWLRLLDPSPLLVVGTRSALLLPFKALQLIIIDEEHDHAYKQTDAMPTYHARDSSMLLAQQHQANVLLGSGTPSIESYYNAKSGKYGLVLLGHRFGSASSPQLFFIDLNIEKKRRAMRDHFSLTLLSKLEKNHREGGQAMIFQNRRGYAQYFLCAACGWIPRCLTCWVSLTYHQAANHLRCHYCDYATPPLQSCQDCGSEQLHNIGFGTEKVEEGLELIFPGQKIGRMDLDSTKGKYSYQSILKEVTTGSIDILVGTQMMAKGLDFPNIRLIGILDIDSMLYFPDFRSNEKCFQLITQLAGRAGRRNAQGSVFIQTRQTHHPLFQYLASGDYEGMYTAELAERKRFLYPPYVRLVRLSLRCIDADTVRSAAMALKQRLEKQFEGMVLGPQQPLVGKIRNHFLLDIFLKIPSKNAATLQKTKDSLKRSCQQALTSYKKVKILWDVDPI